MTSNLKWRHRRGLTSVNIMFSTVSISAKVVGAPDNQVQYSVQRLTVEEKIVMVRVYFSVVFSLRTLNALHAKLV